MQKPEIWRFSIEKILTSIGKYLDVRMWVEDIDLSRCPRYIRVELDDTGPHDMWVLADITWGGICKQYVPPRGTMVLLNKVYWGQPLNHCGECPLVVEFEKGGNKGVVIFWLKKV